MGFPRARGRKGNPEPSAQRKLWATGEGANPEPPGNGHLRAFGPGEIRSHPATGHLRSTGLRGPGATRQRDTSGHWPGGT